MMTSIDNFGLFWFKQIIKMGGISSQEAQTDINVISNVVNSSYTQSLNDAHIDCHATNNLTIDIGGSCSTPLQVKGNLSVTTGQTGKSVCDLTSTNIQQVTNTSNTKLVNDLKAAVTQQSTQSGGWLATYMSIASTKSITRETVTNDVVNNFVTNLSNNCGNSSSVINNGTVHLCGIFEKDVTIDMMQNATATAISQCSNSAAVTTFSGTDIYSQIAAETDQKISQKSEGFGTVLIWIAVIIAAVLIVGLIIKLLMGRGDKEPGEAGDAGEPGDAGEAGAGEAASSTPGTNVSASPTTVTTK